MHKGTILLVKAEDRAEALSNAEEFLKEYGDGRVWDWYVIGGRWTGLLDGYEPEKDPANLDKDGKAKWPTQWADHEGDILPLSACLDKVKEYKGDEAKQEAEHLEHIAKWKAEGSRSMVGYCTKAYGEWLSEDFSFEANVFNVDAYDYSIPEDTKGFWAVVVDMHN